MRRRQAARSDKIASTSTETARRLRPVVYPESDGKPIAETETHLHEVFRLIATLDAWYASAPDIHVGGDLLLYYEEGNRRRSLAPDVFVTKGMSKLPLRRTYLLWEEGVAPSLVIEVTSASTRREDEEKRAIYRRIGVQEYVQYDPLAEWLHPPLQGWRLRTGGDLPLQQTTTGFLSEALGLWLTLEDGRLQFLDPANGARLLTPAEAEAAGRRRAELRVQTEAMARRQAELRAADEAAGRQAAESRVAELEALLRRRQVPPPESSN